MKLGIIVATEAEREPFFEIFGEPFAKYPKSGGYECFRWKTESGLTIFLIQSGFGEIAAASSTQYLIDHFQVDRIINYGAVGGLGYEHVVGKVGFIGKIVHYDFDITASGHYIVGEYPGKGLYLFPETNTIDKGTLKAFGLKELVCASADKFVGPGEPKIRLSREYGANICDMESAGIVITCNRNKIPVTLIKAVSDGMTEGDEAFRNNVHDTAKRCVETIRKLLSNLIS